jgi:hypothetical protein
MPEWNLISTVGFFWFKEKPFWILQKAISSLPTLPSHDLVLVQSINLLSTRHDMFPLLHASNPFSATRWQALTSSFVFCGGKVGINKNFILQRLFP